jgi:hypothetical protein
MKRISALVTVLRRGRMVANPGAWKQRHITVAAVSGLLLAVSQALEVFGYGHLFPLNAEAAAVLAGGILVVADLLLVPATSAKVGLPADGEDPPGQPPEENARQPHGGDDERYLG